MPRSMSIKIISLIFRGQMGAKKDVPRKLSFCRALTIAIGQPGRLTHTAQAKGKF